MKEFYVYIYLDPRKPGRYYYKDFCFFYEPIYVGKGQKDRIREHLYPSARDSNSLLTVKLDKILNSSLLPIYFKLQTFLTPELALDYETTLIREIGRISTDTGSLCNFREKGYISSLNLKKPKTEKWRETRYKNKKWHNHSEEAKKKMSLAKLGKPTGYVHTEESKEKMREKLVGRPISKETREILSRRKSANSTLYEINFNNKNLIFDGAKQVLDFYNEHSSVSIKDKDLLLDKLKKHKVEGFKLIKMVRFYTTPFSKEILF